MALVLQYRQLLLTYHCAFAWVIGCGNRSFVGTMDAPLELTENKNRSGKFGVFSTEADKNIH